MKAKEFSEEFCSYNSWKGLSYLPNFEAVKKRKFLPPIEASIDPIHQCQLNCRFCNASRYLDSSYKMKMRRMPDDHLMRLIKFLSRWGVKSSCFGGGGEPTLHTGLPKALWLSKTLDMQSSVATNGVSFSDELIDAMANYCRWVGVSIDSATAKIYCYEKGADKFKQVLSNIEKLNRRIRQLGVNNDVAFKFLIAPWNQKEIFKACKIAKDLGVSDFHCRPMNFDHQGMSVAKRMLVKYDIDLILEQFKKCHKLATKDFRVFTVMHKYDKKFRPKKNFRQCYAAPICIQITADGSIWFCPDTRFNEFYKLGEHYPNPEKILEFWGGEKHKKLVFETGKKHCTSRCTFGPFCEQAERLVINEDDPMCKFFT